MTDHSLALACKDAADDQDLGEAIGVRWTKRTRGRALFHAVNPQPARACPHHCRGANRQRMAIGVGLHNGQNFGVGLSQLLEETEIVFEGLGADFNPAGACWNGLVQTTSLRQCSGEIVWHEQTS